MTKEKLIAELMKKLQVVRLDLIEKGYRSEEHTS